MSMWVNNVAENLLDEFYTDDYIDFSASLISVKIHCKDTKN